VFFDLHAAGRLDDHPAILIDSNADLIGCYQMVRDRVDDVIAELERLAAGHERDARAHYYRVRDAQFNPERERLRQGTGWIPYTPALAAMFIYLNRTGFNGLFRVNASGAFNVPAGRYARPNIADSAKLKRVARALQSPGVTLLWDGFERARDVAAAGDFLYFDPPYAPLSRTANFTSYTPGRFDAGDQQRLQQTVIALARRGCHVLVSNSTADDIATLYVGSDAARAAGLLASKVPARRAINRDASRRGSVEEFLITNIYTPASQTS